jgi:hypothetical protein
MYNKCYEMSTEEEEEEEEENFAGVGKRSLGSFCFHDLLPRKVRPTAYSRAERRRTE